MHRTSVTSFLCSCCPSQKLFCDPDGLCVLRALLCQALPFPERPLCEYAQLASSRELGGELGNSLAVCCWALMELALFSSHEAVRQERMHARTHTCGQPVRMITVQTVCKPCSSNTAAAGGRAAHAARAPCLLQLVVAAALFLASKAMDGPRPVAHVGHAYFKVKNANKPDELAALARDPVCLEKISHHTQHTHTHAHARTHARMLACARTHARTRTRKQARTHMHVHVCTHRAYMRSHASKRFEPLLLHVLLKSAACVQQMQL